MNDTLGLLEELKSVLSTNPGTKRYADIFNDSLINPIEKELKAFDIIKKKNIIDFNVNRVQENYYLTTGNNFSGRVALTEEEYGLLKEALS